MPLETRDVVIIGAGPAGSTAAEIISKAGFDVLLLERDNEVGAHNSCGGGIGYFLKELFELPDRLIKKEISKVHLAEEVGCIKCHGVSADHANDEDVGATPPDIMYKRHEVDPACAKCHETHDAPAREVVARFLERKLPSNQPSICTDCHGHHRIDRAAEAP